MRRLFLALLAPALALTSSQAFAYWALVPSLGAGITWESNPNYVSSGADAVGGTFAQVGLDGSYKTPADQISLSTGYQQTNYLESNQNLNSENWSVNLGAAHQDRRGNIGLSAGYGETPIRTEQFASATPDDPNAPPDSGTGSGRFTNNGTQRNGSLGANLTYNLSLRNNITLNLGTGDTTYDVPGNTLLNNDYFDYTNEQASLAVSHYLNEKNYFQVALNGGRFNATQQNSAQTNTTDSFGINGAYSYTITETLMASITAGVSRSSVNIGGLFGSDLFPVRDPLTGFLCTQSAPCSVSNEGRNFVGDISIRKRSEGTAINFNASRAVTPQSNGRQVVQDQFTLFVQRTLTSRLSASAGAVFSENSALVNASSALGELIQQNQKDKYYTLDTGLSYQLTPTLSTYGKYSFTSVNDSGSSGSDTNNRLFFGINYRGVGLRR